MKKLDYLINRRMKILSDSDRIEIYSRNEVHIKIGLYASPATVLCLYFTNLQTLKKYKRGSHFELDRKTNPANFLMSDRPQVGGKRLFLGNASHGGE